VKPAAIASEIALIGKIDCTREGCGDEAQPGAAAGATSLFIVRRSSQG
jgi:hypothetical protein